MNGLKMYCNIAKMKFLTKILIKTAGSRALLKILRSQAPLIAAFLSIAFYLLPVNVTAHEQDLNLPKTVINPGSFYYPFKRLIEKGREKIVFSESGRVSFYSSLLKTRLAELDYVTGKKALSEIEASSQRFAYHAGILTESVIKTGKEKDNFSKIFGEYGEYLQTLRDRYPANSSYWLLIQHDINTLGILAERLK